VLGAELVARMASMSSFGALVLISSIPSSPIRLSGEQPTPWLVMKPTVLRLGVGEHRV
jgi:hypothetical protein